MQLQSRSRVLLVDDEPDVIQGYREYLSARFDVFLAFTVKEAMRILREVEIHILVTDLSMPIQDGRVLLSLANREFRKSIKMVLSAYVDEYFDDRFQNEYKVYAVIRKPILSSETLLRFVEDAEREYQFRYGGEGPKDPVYLNAEKVMRRMGISRPTLYRYIRSGLPSKQVVGRRLFDWSEVVLWINQQPNQFQAIQKKGKRS